MKLQRSQWLAALAGLPGAATTVYAQSANGSAGDMPAYYDHELFKINFKELSDAAAQSLLAHNASVNVIFMAEDAQLPGGGEFVAVLDAIQGDGFNPLWLEVEIEFTPGHAPRQLFSDDEIEDAFNAGEITLESTGEVYRCSVVGPDPNRSGIDHNFDFAVLPHPPAGARANVAWRPAWQLGVDSWQAHFWTKELIRMG